MNGALAINSYYDISESHWQQFSKDVLSAFKQPIFGALLRVRHQKQVMTFVYY